MSLPLTVQPSGEPSVPAPHLPLLEVRSTAPPNRGMLDDWEAMLDSTLEETLAPAPSVPTPKATPEPYAHVPVTHDGALAHKAAAVTAQVPEATLENVTPKATTHSATPTAAPTATPEATPQATPTIPTTFDPTPVPLPSAASVPTPTDVPPPAPGKKDTPAPPQAAKKGKGKSTMADFKLLTVLGRGSYGKVTKARRKQGGAIVALKTMHKEELIEYEVRDWVESEKKVLDKLMAEPHPFVVRTTETFSTKALVCHVMDFHAGGDLRFHLDNAKGKKFSPERSKQYFAELASGLDHLHSLRILYRDVKPENVLLNAQGHALLADFGFATILPAKKQQSDQFCGSREYLAPEMITHDERPYSYEVDWWSLGVMYYCMLTGSVPWPDLDEDSPAIYHRICEAAMPQRGLSGTAWDLVSKMAEKKLEDRLVGFQAIKQDPHFEGFDWDALLALEMAPLFVPDLEGGDTKYFCPEYTSMNTQMSIVRKEAAPKPSHNQGKGKKSKKR